MPGSRRVTDGARELGHATGGVGGGSSDPVQQGYQSGWATLVVPMRVTTLR